MRKARNILATVIGLVLVGVGTMESQTPPPPTFPATPQQPVATPPSIVPTSILAWDSESKEYVAKQGETNSNFSFSVTNVSTSEVLVHGVHTSCGCTVAQLPSVPWRIAPGANGEIKVTMDLRGKMGQVTKTVNVNSSAGMKMLTVSTKIPVPDLTVTDPMERERNRLVSEKDPQAVFRGDCARCHATPALGRTGAALYESVCGVCHEATSRASMVPNLHVGNRPATRDFWTKIIMHGKLGTLMPGFAQSHGGPFTDEQILSLVQYMVGPFQSTVLKPTPPARTPSMNQGGVPQIPMRRLP